MWPLMVGSRKQPWRAIAASLASINDGVNSRSHRDLADRILCLAPRDLQVAMLHVDRLQPEALFGTQSAIQKDRSNVTKERRGLA
jgi:hypothetical protein